MTVRLLPDSWQPKNFPPDDLHPTVLFGFVWGGELRWERQNPSEQIVISGEWFIRNKAPAVYSGGTYSLSNLQKQSVVGFLIFKPFLFRVWFMPKKQLFCAHGGHVPNSELGLDIRFPGWRKDYAGHKGKFWDWTFGRIGIHWD